MQVGHECMSAYATLFCPRSILSCHEWNTIHTNMLHEKTSTNTAHYTTIWNKCPSRSQYKSNVKSIWKTKTVDNWSLAPWETSIWSHILKKTMSKWIRTKLANKTFENKNLLKHRRTASYVFFGRDTHKACGICERFITNSKMLPSTPATMMGAFSHRNRGAGFRDHRNIRRIMLNEWL